MNKKIVLTMVVMVIAITCVFSFTACNRNNAIYDIGEYGEFDEYGEIQEHEGYKFIGWANSGKQGLKTVYKAQYEHAEYFLAENKEVYESQYEVYDEITLKMRITNMQTMDVQETSPHTVITYTTTDERMGLSQEYTGIFKVNGYAKEFDGIVTIAIDDKEYNIKEEIKVRVFRNRIKVESIEIIASNANGTGNSIKINGVKWLYTNEILPENASFKSIKYNILEVVRNGVNLTNEEQNQIAYIDNNSCGLYTTDKAQVGDIIRVQAYNERDPEVKSNILTIFVTED